MASSRPSTSELRLRLLGDRRISVGDARRLLFGGALALTALLALGWTVTQGDWGTAAGAGLVLILVLVALLAFVAGRWIRLQQRIGAVATEWQLTLDTVDSPILALDEEGRILRLNRAAMTLSGRSYVANLGRRIAEVGGGEPWRAAGELVSRRAAAAATVEVEDADDGKTWEVTVRPVEDPGRARPTIIVLARDLTETVALQEELRRREVMSALGDLVGGVAHDVRNFLHTTVGIVDTLESELGDREEYRELLALLRQQGERMTVLMQDLLDYGKPVDRRRRPRPIAEGIAEAREACAALAEERGVTVEAREEGEIPDLPLDRERIFQVWKNLLENAVQHSPPGRPVTVTTRRAGGRVECEVRDRGPGLGGQDRRRIFEPFYSRRYGGTGLGLAIVRRVVDQHGGEIEAADHPEGGAVFTVRLPT